jgi:tetratricopeptide (TPR) repeat protein
MPNNNQIDPRNQFAPRVMPWLLALAMLVVYGLTLNHWVTLANLVPVAKVSGFMWQPEFYNPLLFVVTYPFRWLPAAKIPLALNLFSAVCAAATLGMLARSVALLPHDRTESERLRERNDFAFLTTGSAWFPPVLAVALLGLEFGFWQNATSFTGESLNLVVFAFIIWQLLEFRLDERLGRLYLVAVVYGVGLTENWALVGFLPVFGIAILWLRGLEFFNLRFLSRMVLCGLAGMLFFLLLPIVGKMSGGFNLGFWQMLKPALRMDWLVVQAITNGDIRHNLLIMSVTTFLPVLVMAIRWSSSFGDNSRIGKSMVTYLFYGVHAALFTVCVWVMFDSPFSPVQLSAGTPALTMYYLSALGVGYYCGYYLLVFGKKVVPTRRNPRPQPPLPKPVNFFSPVIYWGTYVAAVLAVGTLLYKNVKFIRSFNDDTLLKFAQLTEQSLPRAGGILLSDAEGLSSSQQIRTLLMQAELVRSGRARDFLVVDTQSLNWAPYHRYLHKKSPQKWPPLPDLKGQDGVSPLGILSLLNQTAKSNTICYLNPSFGYYFEVFYLEPHGLTYQLKTLPEATLLPPPLATNLIADNLNFWSQFTQNELVRLQQAPRPRDLSSPVNNPADWLLMHLHEQSGFNPNVQLVENFYSRSLNYWGVELQRAGRLPAAAECFTDAQALNPDNVTAAINLDFNQALQTGATTVIDPQRATPDQFGKYRNWNAVMNANGPFDEPSFIVANSILLAQGGYMRQAIAPFNRARQLAPDNLPVRLWLAQLYLFNHLPDPALENLHDPLTHSFRFGLTESNSTEINFLAAAAHFQKNDLPPGIELLETEMARHPGDTTLLTSAAQAYFMHGLYTNALRVIDRRLAQTPDDPQWLFSQGYANLQLGRYNQAVTALTRVLDIATNDPTARFNRALAYLQSDRLNDARADYAALQSAYTNSFQVAFGLAEIAWRQHATNEAIRNYQLYLANAPTNAANSVESKTVHERLTQLRGK